MTTTLSLNENRWRKCPICAWRRQYIPQDDEATDAPKWTCDSDDPAILRGLHQKPSQVWIDIINTNRLCSPELPVKRGERWWVKIPLRCELQVQDSDGHYVYDGVWKDPHQTVRGYHNTKLESLVTATETWKGKLGNGILVEGRLRYGCCSHENHIGVNVYSDGGLETFDGSMGWVQLEVLVVNTVKLKGGRCNRYCVCGPQKEVCHKAALVALWIPLQEVPPIVYLS